MSVVSTRNWKAILTTFYDRPVLESSDIPGMDVPVDLELRVILNPLATEELARVWQALETQYRLAAPYIVRVVPLQSRNQREITPVLQKRSTHQEAVS